MTRSGFVLAGGASSRMGRDKALLPFQGATLIEHIVAAVREAAGSATIIGREGGIADKLPKLGPIGGLYTALSVTQSEWNLIVACDMPGITVEPLRLLLEAARKSTAECVAAISDAGREPLCAVYHRRCLPAVDRAIREKQLKMLDLLAGLATEEVPLDGVALRNANTPSEWAILQNEPK